MPTHIDGHVGADHAGVGHHDHVAGQPLGVVDQQGLEVRAADLLLALDQELEVDRQAAVGGQQTPGRLDLVQRLALVVDGAPGPALAVDDDRGEGRRRPGIERVDRLHVVVAVDQDGRGAGAGMQPVAVDGRARRRSRSSATCSRPASASRPAQNSADRTHVAGAVGMGRDGRDPQPVEEGGHDAVALASRREPARRSSDGISAP